jgi:chaperonin GroEL
MKEKRDRVEDALNATRAAQEEGVVSGGGVALAQMANTFEELTDKKENKDVGSQIVGNAILEPIKQIAANAGKDGSLILYNIIRESKQEGKAIGYNALEDKFEDLIEAGIIDPTKVVRTALENAASAATMFLTSEAVITEKPKKEGESDAGAAAGMGGGMPMM